MLVVPLQAVPNQSLQTQLAGQATELNIYQTAYSLAIDVYVSGVLIIGGVLCLNENLIVRSVYLGFIGDLAFVDLQSNTDPSYTGLGTQYQLLYLSTDDLAVLNLPSGVS
jgi:hypothetical protein